MVKQDLKQIDDIEFRDVETLATGDEGNKKVLDKFVKELNKEIKNIIKSKNEMIIPPISIFVNQKVLCKSTKGGNFELLSFGDSNDFQVLALGLKS